MMVFRAVEGSLLNQGSVSGTDTTPFGLREDTRAVRIFIDNPTAILQQGAEQTVINSTASGTGVTIQGEGSAIVTTVGKTITVSGGLPDDSASIDELTTVSGFLQTQINDINIDAILGTDGIEVVSGTSTVTVSGFRNEFISTSGSLQAQIDNNASSVIQNASDITENTSLIVTTSGHLQGQIDGINVDELEDAILGEDGIAVISGSNSVTVSGFKGEFVSASGSLQNQIDNIDINEIEPAIVGDDGISVTSGTNITVSGFRSEFVAASGSLSQEIDSDISAHAAVSDAHHSRYTDPEAVAATENARVTVSGHLQAQINNIDVDEPEPAIVGEDGIIIASGTVTTISGFRGEFVLASGSLQSQIDSIDVDEADVSSLNTLQGDLTLAVTGGLGIESAGSTITISGGQGDVSQEDLTTVSGHLQNQINSIDVDEPEDAILGEDGVTIVSGSNTVTVSGFRGEFVSASGSLQSQLDNLDDQFATDSELSVLSGTLSQEIDDDILVHTSNSSAHHTRYSKEENDALLGTDGNTVISGANTITLQSFRPEFVAASGSLSSDINQNATDISDNTDLIVTTSGYLQGQINNIDPDEIEDAILGTDGNTVISGSNSVTVSGFRTEFVSASGSLQTQIDILDDTFATDSELVTVSGHLQSEIDAVNVDELEPAIVGVDGIAVISGTNTTVSGFRDELIAVSGSLSQEIDSDISAHAAITDAHHSRYTDSEAIAATEGARVTVSGHLQNQIDAVDVDELEDAVVGTDGITVTSGSNEISISGFRTEFVSASGSLQSVIDNKVSKAGDTVSGTLEFTEFNPGGTTQIISFPSAAGTGDTTDVEIFLGGGGDDTETGTFTFRFDGTTATTANDLRFDLGGIGNGNAIPTVTFRTQADFFGGLGYGFKANLDLLNIGFTLFSESAFITPVLSFNNTLQDIRINAGDGDATVFNVDNNDTDFQVKSTTDSFLIFGNGFTDSVGIGTNIPGYKLEVDGDFAAVSGTFTDILNLDTKTSDPGSPNAGDVWIRSDTQEIRWYDGTNTLAVSGTIV